MGETDAVGVALVGDHPAVLAGFESWYAASSFPVEVRATGPDAAAALAGPGRSAAVVVLDLRLTSGALAYRQLERLVGPRRRVVVYNMQWSRQAALTCLDLGAFTYLTKAEGQRHLLAATRAAARGVPYPAPTLAGPRGAGAQPRLSAREVDVLLEWFRCESKAGVAERLRLSARTVSTYLDRVRIKYANAGRPATTKAHLVARAVQDGLISLDDL